MGILVIDGNNVFEIDEECYKKMKVSKECDIDKYMKVDTIIKEDTNFIKIKEDENNIV